MHLSRRPPRVYVQTGNGQRVNRLDGVGRLPAEPRQALLQRGFHLPEVGCLSDKHRPVREHGEEVAVMRAWK